MLHHESPAVATFFSVANGSLDLVPLYGVTEKRAKKVHFIQPCLHRAYFSFLTNPQIDGEHVNAFPFSFTAMLCWIVALGLCAVILTIEDRRNCQRQGMLGASKSFLSHSFDILFQKRRRTWRKSHVREFLVTLWSFSACYVALKYMKSEIIKASTPSSVRKPPFRTLSELGALVGSCQYRLIAVKGYFQTTRLLSETDWIWKPLRDGVQQCPEMLVLHSSFHEAVKFLGGSPGSVLLTNNIFARSSLESNPRWVSILDSQSLPTQACFMTPKNSRFIEQIESIANEMVTYGFNKRIKNLNRVKELSQSVAFANQKGSTTVEVKNMKSFQLIFKFLFLGLTISIVIQMIECFLTYFRSLQWFRLGSSV